MRLLPFEASNDFSIGTELEYQLINPHTYKLVSRAKDFIRAVKDTKYSKIIKPEVTQGMLEVNSSIHNNPQTLFDELLEIRNFLILKSTPLNTQFCGGGTHPFDKLLDTKVFPTPRFRHLYWHFQYMSKRSTVFGQHVHVGCSSPEHAIYLTHLMARYTPQLIALSASSPFYQDIDTGYQSTRLTLFNSIPSTCTMMPFVKNWRQFSKFFRKMQENGVANTMKDFYWDVRPKPEFGTVEIRVCDTPLTLRKAVLITAYAQALACYLLQEKPLPVSRDVYHFYDYNKFQAARYGYKGQIINPYDFNKIYIIDDILETLDKISNAAEYLGTLEFINDLKNEVLQELNDSVVLREIYKDTQDLKAVVRYQCNMWSS